MWSQTMTHAELPPSQCKWSSCYKRQRAPSCDTFIRARSRSNACAAVLDPAGGKCVCVFAHLSNFWMRRADGHHTQLPPQAEGSYTGTRVPSCGVYHSVSEDPHSWKQPLVIVWSSSGGRPKGQLALALISIFVLNTVLHFLFVW